MVNIGESLGDITIYDEVLAVIATIAAREIKGVCSGPQVIPGINDIFGKKINGKGVKVTTKDNLVFLEMSLTFEYGYPIPHLAWSIQDNVKKAVENMTGMSVEEVDIIVQGVKFLEESNDSEKK